MHPEVQQSQSGICPKCGMELEASNEESRIISALQRRLWLALILTLPTVAMAMSHWFAGTAWAAWSEGDVARWIQALLSGVVLFFAGADFIRKGCLALLKRAPNMFTLVAIGTNAAWFFSLAVLLLPQQATQHLGTPPPLYFEAAAVIITLILVGQILEHRALGRTGSALQALMDLAPAQALKFTSSGDLIQVDLSAVQEGDTLRVLPGSKIPVDGEVVTGESSVDMSMLTGEFQPVAVSVGSRVRAGTINHSGSFNMVAQAVGKNTLLAQIVQTVSQAMRARAPVQDLADQVAAIFVPIVVLSSIVVFLAWWLWGPTPALPFAITNAIAVLIIACPCAIGLAVPLSITVAVGRAAQLGILLLQPAALERLRKVDTLCVDKTGTLTLGKPEVSEVIVADHSSKQQLWQLAYSLELHSEHPIGAAIVKAAQRQDSKITALEISNVQAVAGSGIAGRLGNQEVRLGRADFAHAPSATTSGQMSEVHCSLDGQWVGALFLEDAIKDDAATMLHELESRGVQTVMLTGDQPQAAQRVATALGLEAYFSQLEPQAKSDIIRKLQRDGHIVCMAGDGVNDAPALAYADVSIAMGAGSDVAKQTAQLILVKGSLAGVINAFDLARVVVRNTRQSLCFAFAYNVLGIPLAAGILYPWTGWLLNPMFAGAAMTLSSLSVIGNALRLGLWRPAQRR